MQRFCTWSFISLLIGALLMTNTQASLVDDQKTCTEWFSDRKQFLTNVNSTSDAMSFTTADGSAVLKYFIAFELFPFLGDNVITMIPWILLISITLLGWLCCATFHLVGVIRKEKLILSPSEKKKFLEAKKAEALANPEAQKEKSEEDSGEEEEEDEEIEDLVEEDVRPSNNPDFKRKLQLKIEREFKISFLAQLILFLGMTGLAIYIAVMISSVSNILPSLLKLT